MAAYSAAALRAIGQGTSKSRINTVVFQTLKDLKVRKDHRGCRGGFRQRCFNFSSYLNNQHDQPISVIVNNRRAYAVNKGGRDTVLKTLTEQFKWDLPTFLNTNARSLENKVNELGDMLREHVIGIAGITETWGVDNQTDDAFSASGYDIIRRDRGSKGGGVLCYVRSDIPYKKYDQLMDDELETLWITARPPKLPREFSNLVVGVVYHPPRANNRRMISHLCTNLDTLLKDHPHSGIVLMGDLNTLPDHSIKSSYNLKQIVTKPTRGANILDKVLTNMRDKYLTPAILDPLGASDHNVVICKPIPACRVQAPKAIPVSVRSTGQNQRAMFANDLMKTNWTSLYAMDSCEEQFTHFQSTINGFLDQHMPLRKSKSCPTDRPWVTTHFRDLICDRRKAYSTGNTSLYNYLRNKVNRLNRKLKSNYYKNTVEKLKASDSRNWWKEIKSITGTNVRGGNELNGLANSMCEGDNQSLANKVNGFFQSVSSDLPKLDRSLLPPKPDHVPDKYIIPVIEVEKQLMKLDTRKAPGPDNIPTWVLHDFPGYLAPPICCIFNTSIREGRLPSVWKKATTRPIPKVIPPKKIETDLRPISLTCVISKEMESHMVGWIWEIVCSSLDPFQFGAIPKCSTVHALVDIFDQWFKMTDDSRKKNYVHAVLVDYSKAFDRINPNILIKKLAALGVPPLLLHWVADFLCDRTQKVKVGNSLSDELDVWGIVPQGTKLGVFLFLLMINDLFTPLPTYKYVDDTTLFVVTNDTKDTSLQKAVDHVVTWSKKNDMRLNAIKTKEMLISFTKSTPEVSNITVDGRPLERVETIKLLGILISCDLTWGPHIEYIVKKGQQKLYCLTTLKRSSVACEDIINIFCSKVRPILEYGAPIWHGGLTKEQSNALEDIQVRACKIAMPKKAYSDALKQVNIPTLAERRLSICKAFFVKMQNPKDKLHKMLPPIKENVPNTRHSVQYSLPRTRTSRYKNSFLPFALYNLQ